MARPLLSPRGAVHGWRGTAEPVVHNDEGEHRMRLRRGLAAIVIALVAAAMASITPAGAQVSYTHATGVEYEVLSTDTKDPLFIQVAKDGRVLWAEREGRIMVLHPDGRQQRVGVIPVSANDCDEKYCPNEKLSLQEGGLYSILLAPNFAKTGHVYAFRSVPGTVREGDPEAVAGNAWRKRTVCFKRTCEVADNFGLWRISRFTIDANSRLVTGSEKRILDVPAEWRHCCHYGGSLEWMPDGTMLLSTGDDMAATAGAYGQSSNPIEGNGERSSMNPADRRGKILRLNPNGSVPDGSRRGAVANPYLVTDDNGVAVRNAKGRLLTKKVEHTTIPDTWGKKDGKIAYDPYVYTLGYKQPFRGTVHPYSGAAIFGEVGPDGFADYPGRGPRGVEELNEIPYGGGVNHGWPRCAGNNQPYYPYDGVDGAPGAPIVGGAFVPGQPFDCSDMEPAVLWYPHDVSERWPSLGSGGVTSTPSTFYPAGTKGPLRLPKAFNDNLIFMEESRSGIIGMPMTKDGHLVTDESQWTFVTPPSGSSAAASDPDSDGRQPTRPIDATVGPDGAVYIVEYSNGFYNGAESAITRLKCSGCTDKLSKALGNTSVEQAGAVPSLPQRLPVAILVTVLVFIAASAIRWRKRFVV